MSGPLVSHWSVIKNMLRYLSSSTSTNGILLAPTTSLHKLSLRAYINYDWASDPNGKHLTLGACLFLGPNLVTCGSNKQSLVTPSSTETRCQTFTHNFKSLVDWVINAWAFHPISSTNYSFVIILVQSCMLSHNPVLHARTKHIELNVHFVREQVLANKHHIHVSTQVQIVNILKKSLSTNQFVNFRDKLKITSLKLSLVWRRILENN